jgi:FlaA1/EpsC-like NDP-sugar epimerase
MTQQFKMACALTSGVASAETTGMGPQSGKTPDHDLLRLEELLRKVGPITGYSGTGKGKALLNSAGSISPDDLLGRNIVNLDVPEVAESFAGRSVLITGAGGSIGSELCRQVLSCSPRRIVLFDLCEFALYSIDREIRPLADQAGVEVAAVLGSICDRPRIRSVMQAQGVEIVLHAAAYKHVPLVEGNEIEGVKNNVFGTRVLAEVARELKVDRFIMISTDKAVRPTNVMGASKRLAEMAIQDLQNRSRITRFAIVRFGNVLCSSGSVIPLFSGQIAAGGPVTVTHPEVTRYFMTIPEAAGLVLLAGAYAQGGDLFVLDMGSPVKIIDLARRMIELSGLTARDAENPDGDIEIRIIGLRPGEKLFEELLIDSVVLPTPHPKILRAAETCPSRVELVCILRRLRSAIKANSAEAVRRQIARSVEGYRQAASLEASLPLDLADSGRASRRAFLTCESRQAVAKAAAGGGRRNRTELRGTITR